MASTVKQVNGNTATNGSLGKRKKTRTSRSSYLTKWLDKTMNHVQESSPSMDTYDSLINSNLPNWHTNSQFAAGFDPCRFMYGCTPEPMSLPTLPTYYNPIIANSLYGGECRYVSSVNKSVQVQRPRQRRRNDYKAEEVQSTPLGTPNSTLNKNMSSKTYSETQDYASLPPIVTSVGDTNSNSDLNANDRNDECSNRRYSDPCIQGLPDVARPANGEVDTTSDDSSGFSGSQIGSRLLSYLLDQITSLKVANERLNKDLQDTKAELNTIRQQNALWQKGSNTSIGTTNHSHLNNNNNGLLGGNYAPGLLTDLVREIRDAARLREEAMYSRVRNMMHDRNENGLTPPDTKYSDRSLEDIKSSLRSSELDKRRMMERINKLEDELRGLRIVSGLDSANSTHNGNIEESDTECVRLRKEVEDTKRAKQSAEEHSLKLERLVTQLRSKFNGLQISPNGPDSIPSEPDHDTNTSRVRRTSVNSTTNSTTNSTVVFGPVTDL